MTQSKRFSILRMAALSILLQGTYEAHFAYGASLPDLVNQPPGIDLGATSFFDGFGRATPGWRFLNFIRFNNYTSISNSDGQENSAFVNPRIATFSEVIEPIWLSPWHFGSAYFGVTAVLPFTSISSHFDTGGHILTGNNFNVGDLQFAPLLQWKPFKWGAHQFYSQRFSVLITAPTGAFNHSVNLNQSSGYWSINPYYAMSCLFAQGWEISARINYLYNFKTTNFGNPPHIPNIKFDSAQAGQAAWINFATSYAVTNSLSFGINGYYFRQFVNDKVNGSNIPGSRRTQLYLGPGAHLNISKVSFLNINLYFPIKTINSANGPEVNLQFIHDF